MTFEPGDVVLVPFAYTDLSRGKMRPALVLSGKAFNTGADVVACAMTSNLQDSRFSVLVSTGDMAQGKLPKPTRVKVGKVLSIQQTIIRKRIGRLKPAAMAQVWKEFRAVFPNG